MTQQRCPGDPFGPMVRSWSRVETLCKEHKVDVLSLLGAPWSVPALRSMPIRQLRNLLDIWSRDTRDGRRIDWSMLAEEIKDLMSEELKFEAWEASDGSGNFCTTPDNVENALKCEGEDAALYSHIYTIIARSWNEAMTIYHDNNGWQPYVPMDD